MKQWQQVWTPAAVQQVSPVHQTPSLCQNLNCSIYIKTRVSRKSLGHETLRCYLQMTISILFFFLHLHVWLSIITAQRNNYYTYIFDNFNILYLLDRNYMKRFMCWILKGNCTEMIAVRTVRCKVSSQKLQSVPNVRFFSFSVLLCWCCCCCCCYFGHTHNHC